MFQLIISRLELPVLVIAIMLLPLLYQTFGPMVVHVFFTMLNPYADKL